MAALRSAASFNREETPEGHFKIPVRESFTIDKAQFRGAGLQLLLRRHKNEHSAQGAGGHSA